MPNPISPSLPTRGLPGRRVILRGMGPEGTVAPPGPPGKSLPVRGFGGRRTLLRGLGPQGAGEFKSSVIVRGFGSKRVISRGFAGSASHGKFPLPILFSSDILGI
jgi:hypothetical protein